MQNQFINIPFDGSDAKGIIYNKFHHQIDPKLYDQLDDNDIPKVYNEVYKLLLNQSIESRPITFSPDHAISSATMAAISEKYLKTGSVGDQIKFSSPVKIIYLTPLAHLDEFVDTSRQSLTKSVLSNLLVFGNAATYTQHNFIPSPENVLLLGLNDVMLCGDDIEKMRNNGIVYFTAAQIREKRIENVLEFVKGSGPVHVVFDMSVMSVMYTPGAFRCVSKDDGNLERQVDGLTDDEIVEIFKGLAGLEVVGVDIMGFNFRPGMNEKQMRVTAYCAKLPLVHLLGLKQKKINVFSGDTKFLIFHPIDDPGIGWYILRGLTIEMEDRLIGEMVDGSIKQIQIGDEEVLVTVTSVAEQKAGSYYDAKSAFDCALIPAEEQQMVFYLITRVGS